MTVKTPNRRAVLAGASALFAAPLAIGANSPTDFDVVVVGAGAAGLAAALDLQKSGRSVIVLEGRDRIGGRAVTDRSALGMPFDQGAHWLHSVHVNPFIGIAKTLGRKTFDSQLSDLMIVRDGEPMDGDAGVGSLEKGMTRLERRVWWKLLFRGDFSFASLAGKDEWQDLAGRYAAFTMATDIAALSARDLARLEGGDDHVVDGGFGQLVADHGRSAPVMLNHTVHTIRWGEGGKITVAGAFGSLEAKACIVTVPTSVLAAAGIAFEPALPVAKQEAIAALRGGCFIKVGMVLSQAAPELTEYALDAGRALEGRMEGWHFDRHQPIATMIVAGQHGRDLVAEGRAALFEHARARLADLAGGDIGGRVRAFTTHDWLGDPFALGSYSVQQIGQTTARHNYAAPVANRLFFAGEAAAGELTVTVAGAHVSGQKAAANALKIL